MKKMLHFYFAVAVLLISVLACGTLSQAGGEESQPEAPTIIPVIEPTEGPQGEPFISVPGIETIKLLTNVTEAGGKPLFTWEAVTGSSRYELIVFDETGEPYWAWEGTKTKIYMGGTDEQPPAESSGPSIEAGYTWTVIAYNVDGKVIAASEIRSISP